MRAAGRILALVCAGLLALTPTIAEEERTMTVSYKKPGENNPLYTQRFGADPGVMTYNGRVYVYMTNDLVEYNAEGRVIENTYSKIRSVNCISSDDLVNWTDHGKIEVSRIAKWTNNSWAPCAAHKVIDGKEKFFLYFCNGGNGIGVLTSDSPTGPWKDELGHALISRITPNCANVTWLFDPAVMVDEDGTGYLVFGGGVPEGKAAAPGTGRIVRLGADMISRDGDPIALDVPYLFEDSGLNRINGKYVYTYCSNFTTGGNRLGLSDGAIQYMTADDPMGPYTYAGELFPNEGRFFGLYGNNHHSVAELNGKLYLFYHNRPVEKAMGITGNYRSPQINEIFVNADGSLKQVVGTMAGVAQLKPLDPFAPVSACTMSHQGGINADGKQVTEIDPGDWTRVTGADFGAGAKKIRLTASTEEKLTVSVIADDPDNAPAAVLEFLPGETEKEQAIALSGLHDVYFVFEGTGAFGGWQAFAE